MNISNQELEIFSRHLILKEFNDNYLDGKRIDLHNIDFSDIKGCHQELRMEMIDAS